MAHAFEQTCPACGYVNRHGRFTAPRTIDLCERCGVRLATGRLDWWGVLFHYGPWAGSIVLTAILGAAVVATPMLLAGEAAMGAERFAALRPVIGPAAFMLGAGCGAAVGVRNWRRHRRGVR